MYPCSIGIRKGEHMENVVPIREPDLVALKMQGKSLREISRETGIPRSTVSLRLKQVEIAKSDDAPSKPVTPPSTLVTACPAPATVCPRPVTSCPRPVARVSRRVRRKIEVIEQTVQVPVQVPVQVSSPRPAMSWMQVFWYSSAGLICLSMVTFLVITSQPFYAESVGSQPLSWLLSVSFELLLFVLASTRTEFRVGVFSPAGFMRAFPSLLKWTIVRLAILGLAFFSYQVVTVGIDVKTAELSRSSSAEVQRDALLKDLEAERALMKSFQLAGAIGSARESSRRMEGIREQISEVSNQTTPASIVEAVETRARVEKALRALALGIVILLGHMLPLNALRKNQ